MATCWNGMECIYNQQKNESPFGFYSDIWIKCAVKTVEELAVSCGRNDSEQRKWKGHATVSRKDAA